MTRPRPRLRASRSAAGRGAPAPEHAALRGRRAGTPATERPAPDGPARGPGAALRRAALAGALLTSLPPAAAAQELSSGDTAWVLTCTALVLLMTAPGLALFYGGLVRRKNVLGTLMQSFVTLALVSVQWTLIGYTLAFAPGGPFVGSLEWIGLAGVGAAPNADYAPTIPHQAFASFQAMFAVITPALIAGAFAERMRFPAFLAFVLLWSTLVYDPLAHMVWGLGGFLRERGALDFAGGTVVHVSSGVAALAAALVIGRRHGYGHEPMQPHSLPLTVLGAGLLWFGWFGFNAGSALGAGGVAANALLTTNTAAAAAALAWMIAEWIGRGRPTLLGAASGAVAGLVAITPACGYVGVSAALAIGAVAGLLCAWAVSAKTRLGYDDALDAFGIHGVGGTWGALATGIFASTAVNPAGADGLLRGGAGLLRAQLEAVAFTWIFAFLLTFAILKVLDRVLGLRVPPEHEQEGLDVTQHSESAYAP